jgi:hypothetical protein
MLTHKTFSFSQNTFFLKKEPVLRKYSSFGKAFLSKKRFVLKEKKDKRKTKKMFLVMLVLIGV